MIISGLRISPKVENPGPAGDDSIRLGVAEPGELLRPVGYSQLSNAKEVVHRSERNNKTRREA